MSTKMQLITEAFSKERAVEIANSNAIRGCYKARGAQDLWGPIRWQTTQLYDLTFAMLGIDLGVCLVLHVTLLYLFI